jgi:hypothetical protein
LSPKTIFHAVSAGTLLAFVTLIAQVRHFAQSQLFGAETLDVQIKDGAPLVYSSIDFIYSVLSAFASLAHTWYGYPIVGVFVAALIVAGVAFCSKGIRVDAAVAAVMLIAAIGTFSYFEAPWLFIKNVPSDRTFHVDQIFDATNRVQLRSAELLQCLVCSRIGDLQMPGHDALCPAALSKKDADAKLTKLFGWNAATVIVLILAAAVYWLARGKLLDDAALPVTSRAVVAVTAYVSIVVIALDVYGAAYVNGKSQMTTKLDCVQQVQNGERFDPAYRIASTEKRATLIYGVNTLLVFSSDGGANAPSLSACTCGEADALTHLLREAFKIHKDEPGADPPVTRPQLTPAKGANQACAAPSLPWQPS